MAIIFDGKNLENAIKNLETVKKNQDEFLKEAVNDIATRVFRLANKLTPVDTGYLRGEWTLGYIKSIKDGYEVEIKNPASYASFVEYGHRLVVDGCTVGWIQGQFMLTISENVVKKNLDRIIKKKLDEFLGGAFR